MYSTWDVAPASQAKSKSFEKHFPAGPDELITLQAIAFCHTRYFCQRILFCINYLELIAIASGILTIKVFFYQAHGVPSNCNPARIAWHGPEMRGLEHFLEESE